MKSVSRQLYSVPRNGAATAYPPAEIPTPTDAQIRSLLRGYDDAGVILPNAAILTDENGKIQNLTIVGEFSITGGSGSDADIALNTFGKINQIDCGTFGES